MTTREPFDDFCALVAAGETVEAIRRYYAEDVTVFENRELARAGRAACEAYERKQIAAQGEAPEIRVVASAFDERTGRGFLEMVVRFKGEGGRPMRLEEVASQEWGDGRIVEERFYYEGVIDEGD